MRGLRNVLIRVGFCSLGAVYAAIGFLALRVAIEGARGRVTGVLHQPDGELLIVNVRDAGVVYVGNAGAVELV